MASVNKVIAIGNVGKDPEMRYTPTGNAVTNFSIACNYGKDQTEWINVTAWKKLAETCNQYLTKGSQVYIEGRLQTRKWDDNDGKTHYKTEVVASSVVFLGGKRGNTSGGDSVDLPIQEEQ